MMLFIIKVMTGFMKWMNKLIVLFVDPDLVVNRMMARQEAAEKLQDKYNQQAKEYQDKLLEVWTVFLIVFHCN